MSSSGLAEQHQDFVDDDGFQQFTGIVVGGGDGCHPNSTVESGTTNYLEMNYHEAAIYLEEGSNNDKFDSHPSRADALPAYLLVHNSWYYGLDLAFAIVLLALALAEQPSVGQFELPVLVHGAVELVALCVIGVELMLKLRWIGWQTVVRHKRTMVKGAILCIMLVEAVVVLVRQSSHFRVTRALRPIFLVDTRACGAVRRYIRQILQSLPPILDMLALLLFFVGCYSLLGYYLFSGQERDLYFRTLTDSFVNMFVLLTTANFPDVMMPSYAASKWNALFFISYIAIVLYILMNLMLAVVYETFTSIEKEKFHKLWLHKRHACSLAFRLLAVDQRDTDSTVVTFRQFQGLMHYYQPGTSQRDVVLIFYKLNTSGTGYLSESEFNAIYDAVSLHWRLFQPPDLWLSAAWPSLPMLCRWAQFLVTSVYFEHLVYAIILCNGVAMFVRLLTVDMWTTDVSLVESARDFCAGWDSFLFLSLFTVEALLKVTAFGCLEYVSNGWNVFDLTVTVLAAMGAVCLLLVSSTTTSICQLAVAFRPLRLLRLFKLKKRYRDIFGTLVLLTPLMWSTCIVLLVVYYLFAIVGMELFAQYDLKNCCANTTVADYYRYSPNTWNDSSSYYYYLNNFSNLPSSLVTLFELTVVNNWFIVMDAYASVAHPTARLYFMLFYLLTMVVMTIVVASVLESFRFRIQYKQQTSKHDEEQMLHEQVLIDWASLQRLIVDPLHLGALRAHFVEDGIATYTGRRRRTRTVLQQHMYTNEIVQWLESLSTLSHSQDLNLPP